MAKGRARERGCNPQLQLASPPIYMSGMGNDLLDVAPPNRGAAESEQSLGLKPSGSNISGASAPSGAKVIDRVAERLDELLEAILRRLMVAIPSYAALDEPALRAEEQARLTALVLLSLRAVLGQAYDETLIEPVRRTARRRAVRGFPLWAMLRSRDIKMRIVWDFIAEELAQLAESDPSTAYRLAIELSSRLLDSSAQLRREEMDAYADAERMHSDTGEKARRGLFEDLLSGTSEDPEELRALAGRLGYRLGERHAVAVVTVDGPGVDASPVNGEIQNILRRLNDAVSFVIVGAGMPLVQQRNDSVVAVFPAAPEDEHTIGETIESSIGPLQVPRGCHLLAGLGRVEPGLRGIAISYRQALRTLEGAHATGMHSGVVAYADMLPSLLLLEDPTLAKDSWRTTVEPLFAHDAEQGTQLVATLAVYLEERGVLSAMAKRLFVHRHTLAPRLERIEQLTGRSLQDRNDLFMLDLGLRARTFAMEKGLNNDG